MSSSKDSGTTVEEEPQQAAVADPTIDEAEVMSYPPDEPEAPQAPTVREDATAASALTHVDEEDLVFPPSELEGEETDQQQGGEDDSAAPAAEGEREGGEEDSPVEPAAEAPVVFDPRLLDIAAKLGVSAEQAQGFSTPKDLAYALMPLAQAYDGQVGAPEARDPPEEEFKLTIDREQVDDAVVDQFEAMDRHYRERHERMVQEFQRLSEGVSATQKQQRDLGAVERAKAIDSWFNEQDKERYGRGSIFSMTAGGADVANRQAVQRVANGLATSLGGNGKVISQPELLAMADRAIFGTNTQAQAETKAAEDLAAKRRQRRGQALARPSQRRARPSGSATEQGIADVEELMRAKGHSFDED